MDRLPQCRILLPGFVGKPHHASHTVADNRMAGRFDILSFIRDNGALIEIRQTDIFAVWFAGLRDHRARARITARIRRLSLGNPGDVKPVGSGVSEMRIDYGPGYRVYFTRRGDIVVV